MDKKSFSTSIRRSKYRSFVQSLTGPQKSAVRACGFGSLLQFDCTEAPRSVAYLLARRFDVPTRRVIMDNGFSFELNSFVTHQILGVPFGRWKIRDHASNEEREIIGNDIGATSIAPTVDHLFSLVSPELSGDKFVRIFMLISLAIFLCPTSYPRPSRAYYSALVAVGDIQKYDWSSFILEWLVEGIADFQKSISENKKTSTLCGCIMVLVLAYFEYIKAPGIILREDWPRIKIWDDRMIHQYLELEGVTGYDTIFGHLELKDPSETLFLSSSVSSSNFGRLPAQVESFIENLPPHNDQDLPAHKEQLKTQIRDICSKFQRDTMVAALGVIQDVVSRQSCSMAELLWNGLRNRGGGINLGVPGTSDAPGSSAHMDGHGIAPTPVQMSREAPGGVTTHSRSKATAQVMSSTTNRGEKNRMKRCLVQAERFEGEESILVRVVREQAKVKKSLISKNLCLVQPGREKTC